MKRLARLGATRQLHLGLVALLMVAASGASRVVAQQPVFSARVDTVRVDVDVRRNEQPVTGLGPGDFEVL